MGEFETFHRWYDSRPKMSQAAKLLFSFPDEIKSILSEAVLEIGEREFGEKKWDPVARSLGREKIMGLHKSKNKRREYDENSELHAAMNAFYILSEDNRELLAEHVLKMVRFIQYYLESCQITKTAPQMEEVVEVTRQYIYSGEKKVQIFLVNLRQALLEQAKNGVKPGADTERDAIDVQEGVPQGDDSRLKVSRTD